MIERVLANVLEISFATSFVIAFVLLLSKYLHSKYSIRWHYWIWMIIAVRLVLPLNVTVAEPYINLVPAEVRQTLQETESLANNREFNMGAAGNTAVSQSNAVETSGHGQPVEGEYSVAGKENFVTGKANSVVDKGYFLDIVTPAADASNIQGDQQVNAFASLFTIATYVWLLGMLAVLCYHGLHMFIFRKNVLRWSYQVGSEAALQKIEQLSREMGIYRKPVMQVCKKVASPMIVGLLRPVLLLPSEQYDDSQWEMILKHELIHYKRHDILYKVLLLAAQAVHWFNPLIYVMTQAANRDLELSCDDRVVKDQDLSYRQRYCQTILATVDHQRKSRMVALSTSFSGGKKSLQRRFTHIFDMTSKRTGMLTLMLLAIVIMSSSVFVACQISSEKSLENGQITGNQLNDNMTDDIKSVYPDVSVLLKYRSLYVGDNSNTINLIDRLPVPQNVIRDMVELLTDQPPYGVIINYRVKDMAQVMIDGAVTDEYFYKNSIVMFSLIDNLDRVTVNLIDDGGQYDGAIYSFTHTREIAEQYMQTDVRNFAENELKYDEFLDALAALKRPEAKLLDQTSQIPEVLTRSIEDKLAVIISSPKSASNPYMYIREHQNEFEDILKMETSDGQVLEYLLQQFAQGNAEGLRGHILMELCIELLDYKNTVPEGSYSTPQEWYEKLEFHQEQKLPEYVPQAATDIEQIVYTAALNDLQQTDKYWRGGNDNGVWIVAPTIYGVYQDPVKEELKIFASIYALHYQKYGDTLFQTSGSRIPTMIHVKLPQGDGSGDTAYELLDYVQARDGSEYAKSIREFSSPHDEIAEKILQDADESYKEKMEQNVKDYVIANQLDVRFFEHGNEKKPIINRNRGPLKSVEVP